MGEEPNFELNQLPPLLTAIYWADEEALQEQEVRTVACLKKNKVHISITIQSLTVNKQWE